MDREYLRWLFFPVVCSVVFSVMVHFTIPAVEPRRVDELEYRINLLERQLRVLEQHIAPLPNIGAPAELPVIRQERVREGSA